MDPMFSGDDPLFSGISIHSLLNLNPSLLAQSTLSLSDVEPPQPLFNLATNNHQINKLLIPKTEHPNLFPIEPHQQLLFDPHLYPNIFPKFHHHRLPDLRSPEDHQPNLKRLRHHETETTPSPPRAPPSVIPQSHLARQRRQKLSEKTRCLFKLMPWDKKMDQATQLEEAYKYVKFLQAQSTVLQSMPTHFASAGNYTHNSGAGAGGVFSELERLNRSQILQILVNSPVAQTVLYSQGLCVFSVEQVSLLRKLAERKHYQQQQQQQQQQISDHATSKPFFF